jgi:hypothetical protein
MEGKTMAEAQQDLLLLKQQGKTSERSHAQETVSTGETKK